MLDSAGGAAHVLLATEPQPCEATLAALRDALGGRGGRTTVIGVASPIHPILPWDPLSASLFTSPGTALEVAAGTAREIVCSLPSGTSGRHLAVSCWREVTDILTSDWYDLLVVGAHSPRQTGCWRLVTLARRRDVPTTYAAGPRVS